MHKTLRLEIIEVASDVTKVFFSNVNLKISKEGNFGPKLFHFTEPTWNIEHIYWMESSDISDIKNLRISTLLWEQGTNIVRWLIKILLLKIDQNSAIEDWRYLMVNTKGALRTQSNIFSYHYLPKAYLEPSRTCTMEFFGRIVNGFKPLTIFAKKLHRRFSTGF